MTVEQALGAYLGHIGHQLAAMSERLSTLGSYPFLVTPADRLHWVYLFTFLVFGLFIYVHQKPSQTPFSLRAFFGFWLPGSIYRHRSTIVDLQYYLIDRVFLSVAFLATLIGSFAVFGDLVEAALSAVFGPSPLTGEPGHATRIAYTVAVILAADLGFFIGHYFGHKVPLFWEFHKVHHSAEVLNPLTNYRFHPLDRVLIGLCVGIMSGLVNGAMSYAYPGSGAKLVAINVGVLLLFNLTANLRHSHLWLSYGWHASHVFSSPAQHQIHHGTAPRHIDKNFGLMFSLWDWFAGTLYVPREKEDLDLGLCEAEHTQYDSVWRLYTLPFIKAGTLLAGSRTKPPGERAPVQSQQHWPPVP